VINQLDSQVLFVKIWEYRTLLDRKGSIVLRVEIGNASKLLAYVQGMDSDIQSPLEVQKSKFKIGGVSLSHKLETEPNCKKGRHDI
jgi:hypothetical protein